MIIIAIIGVEFYNNIQDNRPVIVRSVADKSSFTHRENVTFTLNFENSGKDYNYTNGYADNLGYGYYFDNCYVKIVQIPGGMDPEAFVKNYPENRSGIWNWPFGSIQVKWLDSHERSMKMSWNRTLVSGGGSSYVVAQAGYYCIVPMLSNSVIRFNSFLDMGNIFWIDGYALNVTLEISENKIKAAVTVADQTQDVSVTDHEFSINITSTNNIDNGNTQFIDQNFTLNAGGEHTYIIWSENELPSDDLIITNLMVQISLRSPDGNITRIVNAVYIPINSPYTPHGWSVY